MLRTERRAVPRGGPASEEDALRQIDAVTADQALDRLLKGNRRWVDGDLAHADRSIERRQGLTDSQRPFAFSCIVVGGYYSFDSGAVSILD